MTLEQKRAQYCVFLHKSSDKEINVVNDFIVMCSYWISNTKYDGLWSSQCCVWLTQIKSNIFDGDTLLLTS